jgi:hypothetical protein
MVDLPGYVWALTAVAVLGIPLTTCVVLYRGALAAGQRRRTATTIAVLCGTVWGGWIAVSARLADIGAYRPRSVAAPWFALAFAGALVTALAAARIPAVARTLAAPDTASRLAVPHTLRVAGVLFLIMAALGHIPVVFALPAALGDIAIGLEAPFVARRLARATGRRGAVWFNLLGLLDFVVATTIAFLTGMAPHQILHVSPSTGDLALLPLTLIPTTAVPLAAALHLLSLRRLSARVHATAVRSAMTPADAL